MNSPRFRALSASLNYLYSLYDALVSINVPSDKARAVVDAMERDMGTTLATKKDLDALSLATKKDLEIAALVDEAAFRRSCGRRWRTASRLSTRDLTHSSFG